MKIRLSMKEKIKLFLRLYNSKDFLRVIEHDGFIFQLDSHNSWVAVK